MRPGPKKNLDPKGMYTLDFYLDPNFAQKRKNKELKEMKLTDWLKGKKRFSQ